MSISYVDSVAALPRPTVEQIEAFVQYVTAAHSWYKHLPLLPPGLPFVFYLDPNAGREWIENGSRGGFRDRLPNAPSHQRFHYTWQPTADYLSRFGYLTYFAKAGTSFRILRKDGVLVTASAPRIQVETGHWTGVNRSWMSVPEDVRRLGTVSLTAAVHSHTRKFWPVFMLGSPNSLDRTRLNVATGDASATDKIQRTAIELMRRVLVDAGEGGGIPRLPASLPERSELERQMLSEWAQFQKRQMIQAIHRVLDYIYAGGVSQPAV